MNYKGRQVRLSKVMSNTIMGSQSFGANYSYADYDKFAWLFNHEFGSFADQLYKDFYKKEIENIFGKPSILDLCCGTGQLMQILGEKGYQVTGIDGSLEMLKIAKTNVPFGKFILADIREFDLPPVFDAVVSTYDSLNHLMSLQDLRAAFLNVYKCLVPNGVFLFDLNTSMTYLTQWMGYLEVKESPDYFYINSADYDSKKRLARTKCVVYNLLGKTWQRKEINLCQRCYEISDIESSLMSIGFKGIQTFGLDAKKVLHKYTETDTRAFTKCFKQEDGGGSGI
jgi:SAM-dependent methyltransferase